MRGLLTAFLAGVIAALASLIGLLAWTERDMKNDMERR